MTLILVLIAGLRLWAADIAVVPPPWTDPDVRQIRGPHLTIRPATAAAAESRLLITLGGTNSQPQELQDFGLTAAELGYHVIGIDYPNTVITTVCRSAADLECFDKFRTEIVQGEPASELVAVDRDNCVLHRIHSLLAYLGETDASWAPFLESGRVRWDRVVVAGHSQGSGHAAFLAKKFPVARAILLAGPQDVAPGYTARWLGRAGATPAERFYGFLHALDSFGAGYQLQALHYLMGQVPVEVQAIQDEVPRFTRARILVSHLPWADAHMAPIHARFKRVWAYLLGSDR